MIFSVRNFSFFNIFEFYISVEFVVYLFVFISVYNKCIDFYFFYSRLGFIFMFKFIYIDDCKGFICKDFFCDICILVKYYRLFFNKGIFIIVIFFEFVYIDFWGLYKIFVFNGVRYFLIIVDYCSKVIWIYFIYIKD